MTQATIIMQQKLNAVGYPTPVSGMVHKTDFSDITRTSVQRFKSAHGLENNGYINADFLKKLDKVFYASNAGSSLPASYYKGWNLDIGFTNESQYLSTPDSRGGNLPDNSSRNIIETPDGEIIVLPEEDSKIKVGLVIAVIGIVIYTMKKRKKRK